MSRLQMTAAADAWIMQVIALYDYEPDESDELAFQEGDVMRVVRVQDDGWWHGYVVNAPAEIGLFPSNYVQIQYDRKAAPAPPNTKSSVVGVEEQWPPGRVQADRKHQQQSRRYVEDDEEEEQDEEEAETSRHHVRGSSVQQLKQKLAEAERASRAVQDARRKAEQERLLQRRQWSARDDDGEGDDAATEEEDDEEDGFYTQEQWRQQQKQVESDEDDERDDDDDEDDHRQMNNPRRKQHLLDPDDEAEAIDGDEQDEGDDVDAGEDEGRADQLEGTFSVPVEFGERMSAVIAEYNKRHHDPRQYSGEEEEVDAAASRIARQYRAHREKLSARAAQEGEERQRHASAVIANTLKKQILRARESDKLRRQQSAASPIQRWLVRASSARVSHRDSQIAREEDAASRIQQWMRHRFAYLRWLAHVEVERREMIHRREVERAKTDEEDRRRVTEELALKRKQNEADEMVRCQRAAEQEAARIEQERAREAEPASAVTGLKREKKRVMKKEAVELVKVLVTQQLNDKLREHDHKMLELQHMVARLQDVIREQSEIIKESTDQILDLEFGTTSVPPHPTTQHAHRRLHAPGVSLSTISSTSSLQNGVSSSAMLAKIPTTHSTLPVLAKPSVPIARPSGLKPPRQFERTTKLPVLAPASSANSHTTVSKRG